MADQAGCSFEPAKGSHLKGAAAIAFRSFPYTDRKKRLARVFSKELRRTWAWN